MQTATSKNSNKRKQLEPPTQISKTLPNEQQHNKKSKDSKDEILLLRQEEANDIDDVVNDDPPIVRQSRVKIKPVPKKSLGHNGDIRSNASKSKYNLNNSNNNVQDYRKIYKPPSPTTTTTTTTTTKSSSNSLSPKKASSKEPAVKEPDVVDITVDDEPKSADKMEESDIILSYSDTSSSDRPVTRSQKRAKTRSRKLFSFPPPPSKGAVEITEEDVKLLEPEEFLNDNIIEFYLKYIEQFIVPKHERHRFYFYNTFFYKTLCSKNGFEKVQKWTQNVDIFQKEYLFVPICEKLHWTLIIICFPSLNEKSCMILLDSLRGKNSAPFTHLRKYLQQEWQHKKMEADKSKQCEYTAITLPGHFAKAPKQDNYSDCGIFLLHYVESFVRCVPAAWDEITDKWFSLTDVSEKRTQLKDVMKRIAAEASAAEEQTDEEHQLPDSPLLGSSLDVVAEIPAQQSQEAIEHKEQADQPQEPTASPEEEETFIPLTQQT